MYPEYTGVILSELAHDSKRPSRRRRGLRGGQEVRGGPRVHAARQDAVLRLRRARGQARLTRPRTASSRSPTSRSSTARPHARRAAGVPARASRAWSGSRQQYGVEPDVQAARPSACSTRRSTTARSTPPTSSRPTARCRAASTWCSRTRSSSSASRTSRRSCRQKVLDAQGPDVRRHAQRGQREADDGGDAEDERRGRPRQAEAGRGRQAVPAGQRPVSSRSRSRVARDSSGRRAAPMVGAWSSTSSTSWTTSVTPVRAALGEISGRGAPARAGAARRSHSRARWRSRAGGRGDGGPVGAHRRPGLLTRIRGRVRPSLRAESGVCPLFACCECGVRPLPHARSGIDARVVRRAHG